MDMAASKQLGKKDVKEKELDLELQRDRGPVVQVDRGGNIFSNFISNFRREFGRTKPGEGLLGRLLSLGKSRSKSKPPMPDIMGKAASPQELQKQLKDMLKAQADFKARQQSPNKTQKNGLGKGRGRSNPKGPSKGGKMGGSSM